VGVVEFDQFLLHLAGRQAGGLEFSDQGQSDVAVTPDLLDRVQRGSAWEGDAHTIPFAEQELRWLIGLGSRSNRLTDRRICRLDLPE